MRHVFKAAVLRSALRNIVHWLRLPEARHYLPSASRPLFRPYRTDEFRRLYQEAVTHAPGFTLRGGTNEILRGIVARGLALR